MIDGQCCRATTRKRVMIGTANRGILSLGRLIGKEVRACVTRSQSSRGEGTQFNLSCRQPERQPLMAAGPRQGRPDRMVTNSSELAAAKNAGLDRELPAAEPPTLHRRLSLLLPYLALVFLHLISGLQMEQPLILADELGYLGNARYLAGASHLPDMRHSQFYHFGYSLILIPAFWLFTDPVAIYKAAMVINALLMSALFFPVYSILSSLLEVPKRTAIWISFACSLYPAAMLYSNFAWAENAFIPFYALTVALIGRYLRSGSWPDVTIFSCCAAFLYTIHPRGLPVVVIVVVYLLVLATLRVVSKRQALLSVTTIGLIFAATRVANEHLKAIGWRGTGEFSLTRLGGRLVPGSDLLVLVQRALGQLLYLSQATYGLFLVGLVAAIGYVLKKMVSGSPRQAMSDPKTGVAVFLLITAPGIFLASLTVKLYSVFGPDGIRGAGFIPGRYNEAFAVLFVAFALAELCRTQTETSRAVKRAIGVTATMLGLTVLTMVHINTFLQKLGSDLPADTTRRTIPAALVDTLDVPGVFPVIDLIGELNLYLVSLVAIALYLATTITTRYSLRAGAVLLMLVFSQFSLFNYRHFLRPIKEDAEPRLTFVSQLSGLDPIPALSYDDGYFDAQTFYGLQHLLQRTVFDRFHSRRGETPRSEAVISANQWPQAPRIGAEYFLKISSVDNALWILPGELQSRLPVMAYDGMTLGAEPAIRVRELGFHDLEWVAGVPARWTNGAASLRVPLDPENLPQRVEVEILASGRREGADLQILTNGVELWRARIPANEWSKTLSLKQVPMGNALLIELNSDTSTPAASHEGSPDSRRLGVMVKAIRLQTSVSSDGPRAVNNKSQ